MYDEYLAYPAEEARFWEDAAQRWQELGGLLVLFTPLGNNRHYEARNLQRLACSLGLSMLREGVPRLQDTTLVEMNGPAIIDAVRFWQRVTDQSGQGGRIADAIANQSLYYLCIYGVSLTSGMDPIRWARALLEQWFGGAPCPKNTPLHVCLLLSAPRPTNNRSLPETADLRCFPDCSSVEIINILRQPVCELWMQLPMQVQRYIAFGLADMASGRRAVAEAALTAVYDDFFTHQRHDLSELGWRLRWRSDHDYVRDAAEQMRSEGLTTGTLRRLLSTPVRECEDEERQLIDRLWGRGLWASSSYGSGLFYGLTAAARTALEVEAENWLLPPIYPASSLDLLQRTLAVEQKIKHILLERLMIEDGSTRNGAVTVKSIINKGRLGSRLRDQICQSAPTSRRRLSPDQLVDEANLISICSWGHLAYIVQKLVPSRYQDLIQKPIREIGDIRNFAAHCGWFTATEFHQAHELIDSFEDHFSFFRLY